MILLLEKELAHYRVPIFERLDERLNEDLFVVHGDPRPCSSLATPEAGADLPFRHLRIRNHWLAGGRAYVQNLFRILWIAREARAVVARHSIRNLGLLPLLKGLKAQGIPAVVWGQGYSRTRPFRPYRHFSDQVHLRIVRASDAYVCYSEEISRTLSAHTSTSKLFVARNTLDVDRLLALRDRLEEEGREAVRSRLDLDRSQYLVFSGRLQPRKKIRTLLELQKLLVRGHGVDSGLLIIGDGPERGALERKVKRERIEGVTFLGSVYGRRAAEYLFAADVLVMPGWMGLAVVHAFAMGLPVVGQRDGPGLVGHPPEAAYVRECPAGRIVAPGPPASLADAVHDVLEVRHELGEEARSFVRRELTLDRMTEGFLAAIRHAEREYAPPLREES